MKTKAHLLQTQSTILPAISPVRVPLRLSNDRGRAEEEAIHSNPFPATLASIWKFAETRVATNFTPPSPGSPNRTLTRRTTKRGAPSHRETNLSSGMRNVPGHTMPGLDPHSSRGSVMCLSLRESSKWRSRSSLKCHIRMEIQTHRPNPARFTSMLTHMGPVFAPRNRRKSICIFIIH